MSMASYLTEQDVQNYGTEVLDQVYRHELALRPPKVEQK
jgi:hypothetical protein